MTCLTLPASSRWWWNTATLLELQTPLPYPGAWGPSVFPQFQLRNSKPLLPTHSIPSLRAGHTQGVHRAPRGSCPAAAQVSPELMLPAQREAGREGGGQALQGTPGGSLSAPYCLSQLLLLFNQTAFYHWQFRKVLFQLHDLFLVILQNCYQIWGNFYQGSFIYISQKMSHFTSSEVYKSVVFMMLPITFWNAPVGASRPEVSESSVKMLIS